MPPKKKHDKKGSDNNEQKQKTFEIPLKDTELESILKDYLISFHKYKTELKDYLWHSMQTYVTKSDACDNVNLKDIKENTGKNENVIGSEEDVRKIIENGIKRMKNPEMQEKMFTSIMSSVKNFMKHEDKLIKKNKIFDVIDREIFAKNTEWSYYDNFRVMLGSLGANLKSSLDVQNNKLWFLVKRKINLTKSGKSAKEDMNNQLLQGVEKQELDEQILDIEQKRYETINLMAKFNAEKLEFDLPENRTKASTNFVNKQENSTNQNEANSSLVTFLKSKPTSQPKDVIINDFINTYIEDQLILTSLNRYKNYRLNNFVNVCDTISEYLFIKEFASTPKRMWSSFYVHGSWSVPSRSIVLQKKPKEKPINVNYIETLNEMLIYDDINKDNSDLRPFLKYRQNKYFDNCSISKISLNILYNCFRRNCPKIVLEQKALDNFRLEEIDNFEEFIAENIYDLLISSLKDIGRNMNEDVMYEQEPVKEEESIINANKMEQDSDMNKSGIKNKQNKKKNLMNDPNLEKTDNVQIAMEKHGLKEQQILEFGHKIDSVFLEIYENQMKFLEFADYYDIERIMILSDKRIQLKDEKNPNEKQMRRINKLDKTGLIRVKKFQAKDPIDNHFMQRYQIRKELKDRNVHPLLTSWVNFLTLNSFDFTQERLEAFINHQQKEKDGAVNTEKTSSKKIKFFLTKSNLKLLLLTSRSYLIKLISQFNYVSIIQKRLSQHFHDYCNLVKNYDDPLRFVSPEDKTNLRKPKPDENFPKTQNDNKFTFNQKKNKDKQAESHIYEDNSDDEYQDDHEEKFDFETKKNLMQTMDGISPSKAKRNYENVFSDDSDPEVMEFKNKPLYELRSNTMKENRRIHINEYENEPTKIDKKSASELKNNDSNKKKDTSDRSEYETISFECLGHLFNENSNPDLHYIKAEDKHKIEIIYESAMTDVLTCLEELSRLVSYFLENNALDYSSEVIELTMKDENALKKHFTAHDNNTDRQPQRHLNINIKEKTENLNLEYLINKFLEYQSIYMNSKIEVVERMMSVLDNLTDKKNVIYHQDEINEVLMEKVKLDIQPWGILNEKPDEVFNNKISNHLANQSLKKELHCYIITVFDQYKLATDNNKRLYGFYDKLIDHQEKVYVKGDDYRHRFFGNRAKNRKTPNLEFCDNFDSMVVLPRKIRNAVKNLKKTYFKTENIDEFTFNEIVIEQNYKQIFKTVKVEYTNKTVKEDEHYLSDKFVQYALCYCLRSFLHNQLERRQSYIEQLLEGVVVKTMETMWNNLKVSPMEEYSETAFHLDEVSLGKSYYAPPDKDLETLDQEDIFLEKKLQKEFKVIAKFKEMNDEINDKPAGGFKKDAKKLEQINEISSPLQSGLLSGISVKKERTQDHYIQKFDLINNMHFYSYVLSKRYQVVSNFNRIDHLIDIHLRQMELKYDFAHAKEEIFNPKDYREHQTLDKDRFLVSKHNYFRKLLNFQGITNLSENVFSAMHIANEKKLFEIEGAAESTLLTGDTKMFSDYLEITYWSLRQTITANNLKYVMTSREILQSISKVMTNNFVTEKFINNIDIIFGKDIKETDKKVTTADLLNKISTKQFLEGDKSQQADDTKNNEFQEEIKTMNNSGPNDITFGSRNESIMRRLYFKALESKVDEIFTDYLEIQVNAITQTKENHKIVLKKSDGPPKKININVIKPVSNTMKAIGRNIPTTSGATRPNTESSGRNDRQGGRMSQANTMAMLSKNPKEEMFISSSHLDICRTNMSAPFVDFLCLLRRNIHYEGTKIMFYYKTIEQLSQDDKIFPGINQVKQTSQSNFTLNTVNNFFWSSICLKKVSNSFGGSQLKNIMQQIGATNEKAQKELERQINNLQTHNGVYEDPDKGHFSFGNIDNLDFSNIPNFEDLAICFETDYKNLFTKEIKPVERKYWSETEVSFNSITVALELIGHEAKKKTSMNPQSKPAEKNSDGKGGNPLFGVVNMASNKDEYELFDIEEVNHEMITETVSYSLEFFKVTEENMINHVKEDFAQDTHNNPEQSFLKQKTLKGACNSLVTNKFKSATAAKVEGKDNRDQATPASSSGSNLKLADGTLLANYFISFSKYCDTYFLYILEALIENKFDYNSIFNTKGGSAPLYVLKFINMFELDLLHNRSQNNYEEQEEFFVDQENYYISESMKLLSFSNLKQHFKIEEEHLIKTKCINTPENPVAAFCNKRDLATITYIENPFEYCFRDMMNRVKIILYKLKKDQIHRRKIYSTLKTKLSNVLTMRKENVPVKNNFSKFCGIYNNNIEKTFMAALLDLRAKIFVNEENRYQGGKKDELLKDFTNVQKNVFLNDVGDIYHPIKQQFTQTCRKDIHCQTEDLLNSTKFFLNNIEFTKNFDESILDNSNLQFLLLIRDKLRTTAYNSDIFDLVTEKMISRNDRIIETFGNMSIMEKSFLHKKIGQINENFDQTFKLEQSKLEKLTKMDLNLKNDANKIIARLPVQVMEIRKKAILEVNIKVLMMNEVLSTYKSQSNNDEFFNQEFLKNLRALLLKKRKPLINFFFPNLFSQNILPLEYNASFEFETKKGTYMKNDLLKVLINQIKQKTKSNEIKWAIDHYEKTTKREIKNKIKNQEIDHFLLEKINLCSLLESISSNSFSGNSRVPNEVKLQKEEDLILHYTSANLNGTFIEFDLENVSYNLQLFISEILKNTITDQSDFLLKNFSIIFCLNKNAHITKMGINSKDLKTDNNLDFNLHNKTDSSGKNFDQIKKHQKLTADKLLLEKKIANEFEKSNFISEKIMVTNNSFDIFPPLSNMFEDFINGAFIIETNNYGDCYLIKKEELITIMKNLLWGIMSYNQKFNKDLKEYYQNSYLESKFKNISQNEEIMTQKKNFSDIIENFHKIMESKIAEKNFDLIYELDRLAKYIKYTNYDNNILMEKIKDNISLNHERELNNLWYEYKSLESRLDNYNNYMGLYLKEFITSNHHENLLKLKDEMRNFFQNVNLYDVNSKKKTQYYEKIEDEKLKENLGTDITNTAKMIEKMKLLITMRHNQEKEEKEKHLSSLEEQLKGDENLILKIQELARKEEILRNESGTAQTEINQLKNQNSVLQKDIHNCQYERLELIQLINLKKKELEDLNEQENSALKNSQVKKQVNSHMHQCTIPKAGPKHISDLNIFNPNLYESNSDLKQNLYLVDANMDNRNSENINVINEESVLYEEYMKERKADGYESEGTESEFDLAAELEKRNKVHKSTNPKIKSNNYKIGAGGGGFTKKFMFKNPN